MDLAIVKFFWKDKYMGKFLKLNNNKGGLAPLESKTYSKSVTIKTVILVLV